MKVTGGILLCAGFGSRLMPLTGVIPKPAIPFCGAPMAHFARRAMERAGVSCMGMNVHHLPDQMIAAMDDGTWKNGICSLAISHEGEEILGTGGGAARVAALMPACEQYIIYHGDVLCGADLSSAIASHEASGARVTLVVLPRPKEVEENVRKSLGMIGVVDGEIVCIRDWWKLDRRLEAFDQRCFSGIHIVDSSVLKEISSDKSTCLVTEVYRGMLERGERINAFEPENEVFFADVGTPATYLEAQARYLQAYASGESVLSLNVLGERLGSSLSYAFGGSAAEMGLQQVDVGENVCVNGVCQGRFEEKRAMSNEMICADGGIRADGAWIKKKM